jgi:hypothetical protein
VEQEEAFRAVKKETLRALELAIPDFTRPFRLETDASRDGFGEV